jgi:hypothetical protein
MTRSVALASRTKQTGRGSGPSSCDEFLQIPLVGFQTTAVDTPKRRHDYRGAAAEVDPRS